MKHTQIRFINSDSDYMVNMTAKCNECIQGMEMQGYSLVDQQLRVVVKGERRLDVVRSVMLVFNKENTNETI